jgi:hypothetical protein
LPFIGKVKSLPRHVVFRSYNSVSDFGGGQVNEVFRPEWYEAKDMTFRLEKLDHHLMRTTLLADGKPIRHFTYFAGDEWFSCEEIKDE